MSYQTNYPPKKIPPSIVQRKRQQRMNQWSFEHDKENLKGFIASKEFKQTLNELTTERNRPTQILIKDSLWDLLDHQRTIWLDDNAYEGDSQIMFRCSNDLLDQCNQFCEENNCSLTVLCKQAIIEWFYVSDINFNQLVEDRGGNGL